MNSINHLNRQKALYFLSAFAISLSIGRAIYTQHLGFLFLIWNLFLAWIPYLISNYAFKETKKLNLKIVITMGCWLLFLPNAPYLVTDLVHFHSTYKTRWLDLVILCTYALTGILLFYFCIRKFKHIYFVHLHEKLRHLALIAILGASAYGIYLGRVLRFNSWDVLTNPMELIHSIINSVFKPGYFIHTAYITLLFMVFLYISVRVFDFLFYADDTKYEV